MVLDFRFKILVRQVGTLVFLLRRRAGDCGSATSRRFAWHNSPSKGKFSFGARRREHFIVTPDKSCLYHLHRKVERLHIVVTTRETLSTRGAAAPPRPCLTANPYKNLAQSGVSWIDQAARDQIQVHCCGVFSDASRQGVHEAPSKHVRMGQSIPQGTSRHCAPPQHRRKPLARARPQHNLIGSRSGCSSPNVIGARKQRDSSSRAIECEEH